MNKRGIEFSFNWIFSIVAGAVIIFLAIYATTSYIKTERTLQDTETVQDFEALLNPLQTSIESATKPSLIIFPREVKITTQCTSSDGLGEQLIYLSSKNNVGGAWNSVSFPNKVQGYLFAESPIQGKQLSALIMPVYLPYKTADIIMLWTGDYCFVNSPDEVKSDLQLINNTGAYFTNSKIKCRSDSKSVCFINSAGDIDEGCDIRVNTYLKQVRAQGKLVYYEGPFMYAAIFSNSGIYECNVKRILLRAKELALLYSEKSFLLGAQEQCGGSMNSIMINYANSLSIEDSSELSSIFQNSNDLEKQQGDLLCALWK